MLTSKTQRIVSASEPPVPGPRRQHFATCSPLMRIGAAAPAAEAVSTGS